MLKFSKRNLIDVSDDAGSSSEDEINTKSILSSQHFDGSISLDGNKVDEDHISEALGNLFLAKDITTLNKKILFGTISK